MLVFFLKRKTAYEVGMCLEFRRVLFRSGAFGDRRVLHGGSRTVRARVRRTRRVGLHGAAAAHRLAGHRSEERRVGEEASSYRSPYLNHRVLRIFVHEIELFASHIRTLSN